MRITPLDQLYLPVPLPFLESLLSLDRSTDIIMFLEVNEAFDAISPGKPRLCIVAMFPSATDKVTRYADV